MGTKERRERLYQARETQVLATARELIVRDGLLNLQMSKLAAECELAMGTLYQHFSSKEDLLLALTTQGVAEQALLFRRAADWQASTRDRIFAITVADTLFVQRNPEHFRIAQYIHGEVAWKATSPARRAAHFEASQPLAAAVHGIVTEALDCGDLEARGLNPESISTVCWALTAGMHQLVHAEGLLDHFNVKRPYRLLGRQMLMLLNGMGWQPLVADPADPDTLDQLISRIRAEVFDDLCLETKN